MSKVCLNCQKKISYLETAYPLTNSKEYLCNKCNKYAVDIISEYVSKISTGNLDEEGLNKLSEEYSNKIEHTDYTMQTKQALRNELEQKVKDYCNSHREAKRKLKVNNSIEEVSGKINSMLSQLGSSVKLSNQEIIQMENVTIIVLVYEKYDVRNGGYTSLTVTLASDGQDTHVSTIGSGGGYGLLNLGFGSEEDFVSDFWRVFLN